MSATDDATSVEEVNDAEVVEPRGESESTVCGNGSSTTVVVVCTRGRWDHGSSTRWRIGSGREINKKVKVSGRERRRLLTERKNILIENNMTRDDDAARGEIEAPISIVVSRVSKEDTRGGMMC